MSGRRAAVSVVAVCDANIFVFVFDGQTSRTMPRAAEGTSGPCCGEKGAAVGRGRYATASSLGSNGQNL